MDRRKLLTWAVRGTGAVVAGVVAVPALVDSLSPVINSDKGPKWRSVGAANQFAVGEVTKAVVSADEGNRLGALQKLSVYVWRKNDQEFVVYSRACTDLGCPVSYDAGSEWFYCPCHGGIFDKEGNRKAGPPPRPLWRYVTRIGNGQLEIDLHSVPPVATGGS